jgi:Zn-dependent protease with chaperone function
MTSETWADIIAQATFHTLVASLFVEALVRSWRVVHPGQRIALRLTALGYPLVAFPALLALFPVRRDEGFRDDVALLAGRRWNDVQLLGIGLFDVFVVALVLLGASLVLMDLVPFVRRLRRQRLPTAPLDAASAAIVEPPLRDVVARAGLRPPQVRFVDREAAFLFCTGVLHPTIVISRGALRLLDPAELRAALAHEVAHLRRRDPAASWGVLAARVVMAFNPAFQVVSRALAREAERLADERAAALVGDRLALASALLKLHRAGASRPALPRGAPLAAALSEPLARVRARDIEVRCRRLLDGAPPRLRFGAVRVALAAVSVTALLFFVV